MPTCVANKSGIEFNYPLFGYPLLLFMIAPAAHFMNTMYIKSRTASPVVDYSSAEGMSLWTSVFGQPLRIQRYIYIYIYRYHTITDVCTTALLPTKPSLDADSRFRHNFGAETSLPLAQSTAALFHDTTRLCQIVAIFTLMQLELYLGSFPCISSWLIEEIQD